MDKWRCTICNYAYNPAEGNPEAGIEPGTAFEDLPDDWVCPICGATSPFSKWKHKIYHCSARAERSGLIFCGSCSAIWHWPWQKPVRNIISLCFLF